MREGKDVTLTIPGAALVAALSGVQAARYALPVCEERHELAYAAMCLSEAANQWEAERPRWQAEAEVEAEEEDA